MSATRVFRIPEGRFCRWFYRTTNPRFLITRWPLGGLVRLRFLTQRAGGGCVVLVDRRV